MAVTDPTTEEAQVEPPKRRRRGCKIALAIFGVVVLVLGVWLGPLIYDGFKSGLIQSLFAGDPNRKYEGTTTENLKAMRTALMLYHDSEGQFPRADGWMDAISQRLLQTADLADKEGEKKMIRPALLGNPGQFGYSLSDAASGRYKGDIKDPKTPLIFESADTKRNAHGDPAKSKMRGGYAIAVDGTIIRP